jgi:predicted dithiol-disulfide oxidoreductase (DUF899 family)
MDPIRYPNESAQYRAARDELLTAEMALREQIERVAAQRRALPPGGELAQDYQFTELVNGQPATVKFSELFGSHQELLVYNLMYGGDMKAVCPMCAAMLDSLDGQMPHIQQHVSAVVIADHEIEKIQAVAEAMGWHQLRMVSSHGTDYGRDYFGRTANGQIPIANVFEQRDGVMRHSWGTEMFSAPTPAGMNPRHVDAIWPLWNVLDMTRAGRPADWYPALNYDG